MNGKQAIRNMAKSKYNDDFPLLAEDYARQGLIDKEIAAKLGIGLRTLYEYQNKYPQFLQAIKRGKKPVDVEVENSLLKRAKGYEYEETTVEYKPSKSKDEKAKPTKVKKTKKQVIPDVTALIFWLKNRRPDLWKDKQEVGLSGNAVINIISRIPRSKKKKDGNSNSQES